MNFQIIYPGFNSTHKEKTMLQVFAFAMFTFPHASQCAHSGPHRRRMPARARTPARAQAAHCATDTILSGLAGCCTALLGGGNTVHYK